MVTLHFIFHFLHAALYDKHWQTVLHRLILLKLVSQVNVLNNKEGHEVLKCMGCKRDKNSKNEYKRGNGFLI